MIWLWINQSCSNFLPAVLTYKRVNLSSNCQMYTNFANQYFVHSLFSLWNNKIRVLFWKNQTKSFSCGFYFDRILFISFHFPEFMYSIIHAYHIYELNRRKYVKLRHKCVVYDCSWALAKYFAKKPPSNCIGKYIRVSFSLALSYSLDLSRRYDMIRMNYISNWKRITTPLKIQIQLPLRSNENYECK